MPETDDPVLALSQKSIAKRVAGARELSLHGTVEHIPLLLEKAKSDKSPAMRLISCTAAADILSRHRIGRGAKAVDTAKREELLPLIGAVDPGRNTAMFSVLACLDLPVVFSRLSVGMRDPRGNVRTGAAVGLWRHVMSASRIGDEALESGLIALVRDARLPPDSQAEMARICAAGGYTRAIPSLLQLDLGGMMGALVTTCIEALEAMKEPQAGPYWSDGRDAGEVSGEAQLPLAGMLLTADGALMGCDGAWSWAPASSLSLRPLFFRRVGEATEEHSIQTLGRTWVRSDPAIIDMVDLAMDVPRLQVKAEARVEGERARHLIGHRLPENSDGDRARGLLALGVGDLEQGLAAFDASIDGKKTPPDTWFLQAETRMALGDRKGAEEAWSTAIDRARRKRDWQVARARKRLS